jgi:hypothetical protein
MKMRAWIAVGILAFVAVLALGTRYRAVAQPPSNQVGRYQISAAPGKPPQFGYEIHGPGCYMVDTTTGELWFLTLESNKSIWKRVTGGVR